MLDNRYIKYGIIIADLLYTAIKFNDDGYNPTILHNKVLIMIAHFISGRFSLPFDCSMTRQIVGTSWILWPKIFVLGGGVIVWCTSRHLYNHALYLCWSLLFLQPGTTKVNREAEQLVCLQIVIFFVWIPPWTHIGCHSMKSRSSLFLCPYYSYFLVTHLHRVYYCD